MSPFFGKHEDSGEEEGTQGGRLPRPAELGSQLDDVVKRVAALLAGGSA